MAELEIELKNHIYELTGNTLTIYKKSMFGARKLSGSIQIPDIELLHYQPDKVLNILYVTPAADGVQLFEAAKDEGETLQKLYDELVARGAVERPMGRMKAAFTVHTRTKERQEEAKALKKAKAEEATAEQRRRQSRRAGCKEKVQEKFTCTHCGATWFANAGDGVRAFVNATNPNLFTLNQSKDFTRCPKCGSSATSHKTVKYWVDKKGNCVDMEE